MHVHYEKYDVEKVITKELIEIEDGSEKEHALALTIPQRAMQLSIRMGECETVHDDEVGYDGEMMHLAMFVDFEPVDYWEALKEHALKDTMDEKLSFLEKNKTWESTKLPESKKAIAVMWMFNLRVNPEGIVIHIFCKRFSS